MIRFTKIYICLLLILIGVGFIHGLSTDPAPERMNTDKINVNSTIVHQSIAMAGKSITVSGTLKDESGNGVSDKTISLRVFTNNGWQVSEHCAVTDEDGEWQINYIPYGLGDFTFMATLKFHDKIYNDFINQSRLIVVDNRISANSTIEINDKNVNTTHKIDISGTLKDEYGTNVPKTSLNLTVNNKNYNVITDNNGEWSLKNTPININTNKIRISLKNNPYFMDFTNTTEYNFIPTGIINSTINAPTKAYIGEIITISGTLKDEYGNPIHISTIEDKLSLSINDKQFYTLATNQDGEWSLKYIPQTVGDYTVKISLKGHKVFNDFVNSTNFPVTKMGINSTIILPKSMRDTKDVPLFGELVDEDGKSVPNTKLNITITDNMGNDKREEVQTDKRGQWTLIYTPTTTVGTTIARLHTVDVSLTNHNYYNDFLNTTSFNMEDLKIPINSTLEHEKHYHWLVIGIRYLDVWGTATDNRGGIPGLDLNLTLKKRLAYDGDKARSKKYKVKTNSGGEWKVEKISFEEAKSDNISPQIWDVTISLKDHPIYKDYSKSIAVAIEIM